jgi:uncharacterized membrane protein
MLKKNITSIVLICVTIVLSAIAYPFLPDSLAIQFGSDNTPTNAAPKFIGLAIAPVVMIFLLFTRKDTKKFVHGSNLFESRIIYYIVQFVLLGGQITTILYGLGYRFDINLIGKMIIGAIYIILGNYLYRAKRSYGHGIKTRWTLSNEKVWNKTHKFSSFVFVLAGIIVILINFVGKFDTEYTFGVLIGSVLICYAASFVIYQRYKED